MINHYKVADCVFSINVSEDSRVWSELKSHYQPFACDMCDPILSIDVTKGSVDDTVKAGMHHVMHDEGRDRLDIKMNVYDDGVDSYLFEIIQPGEEAPHGWLRMSESFTKAEIIIDEDEQKAIFWKLCATFTSMVQLAYMLAANRYMVLMAHSSCVLYDGYAYMFIAKSGTGKSTHSSLWLKNHPGSVLLNDDHPIVRVGADGSVTVYGSPWSGKTHCYKNLKAPAGAIVRIKRAPYNKAKRQSIIEAYASLCSSFSGMTIVDEQADRRHSAIEGLIKAVPCYELECLPDDNAAKVCLEAVKR